MANPSTDTVYKVPHARSDAACLVDAAGNLRTTGLGHAVRCPYRQRPMMTIDTRFVVGFLSIDFLLNCLVYAGTHGEFFRGNDQRRDG